MISAIRFLDASGQKPGFRLDAAGRLAYMQYKEAVHQSLVLLLSTRPGERLMRPEYGCDLHKLVFAVCDETTAGLAIHSVKESIRRFEPRAEVLDVSAEWQGYGALRLSILYRARGERGTDNLTWQVEFAEGR